MLGTMIATMLFTNVIYTVIYNVNYNVNYNVIFNVNYNVLYNVICHVLHLKLFHANLFPTKKLLDCTSESERSNSNGNISLVKVIIWVKTATEWL